MEMGKECRTETGQMMELLNAFQKWGFLTLRALFTLSVFLVCPLHALEIRLKDVVSIEGIRENQLIGYGLVVGLNGTGDTLKDAPFALETMVSMLDRLGVNVRDKIATMKTKNVAAVMVTANLPAFGRQGSRMDVSVSAIGTSQSLQGGTLLVTPLLGADGGVYAVAQGPITIGGFSAAGLSGSSVVKGVPTTGRIASGAIIEKETGFELADVRQLKLSLHNPDFTTAKRIEKAINIFTHEKSARLLDNATVQLTIPKGDTTDIAGFLTAIEQLTFIPDHIAKVVIDESNGVIVMGDNVRISKVAVSHGNLTIRIAETPQVSQPNPFSTGGQTEVVNRSQISVDETNDKKMTVLPEGVTLDALVKALNTLGVSPRDMITILRTIKAAGALQAEIEVL